MQTTLVMTFIGADRTGLVESIARVIAEYGGNWLESRMCRLGGEFAGILRVTVPEERREALVKSLADPQIQGLTVTVRADPAKIATGIMKTASLSLIGNDRPGIVLQISGVLARHAINVEELETECFSAPMSGDAIFKATATLQIPGICDLSQIRSELEELGTELMVDVSLTD
jgi:glycine cleavage system regulatory protein